MHGAGGKVDVGAGDAVFRHVGNRPRLMAAQRRAAPTPALTTVRPALSFGRARSFSSAPIAAACRSASAAKPAGDRPRRLVDQRDAGVQHAHDRHFIQRQRRRRAGPACRRRAR